MRRSTFLLVASLVGLSVGAFALLGPVALLATKVEHPSPQTAIWVREVGVLLLAVSGLALAVRHHPASPTLRAILWANAAIQLGLLPIELVAWTRGEIASLAGIAPNTAVHVILAAAFAFYARAADEPAQARSA